MIDDDNSHLEANAPPTADASNDDTASVSSWGSIFRQSRASTWRDLTRWPGGSDADGDRFRFWRETLLVRALSSVVFVAALFLHPALKPTIALVALSLVGVAPLALLRQARRHGGLPALAVYPETIALLVVLGLQPKLLWPGVVVLSASITTIAALHGRRHAALLALAATPVLLTTVVRLDAAMAVSAMLVWSVVALTAIVIIGEATRMERRSRQNYAELIADLGAVLWHAPEIGAAPTYVSGNVARMFGYPKERYLKQGGIERIAHREDRPLLQRRLAELAWAGSSDVCYRVIDAKGRTRWVQEHITTGSSDGTNGVRGILIDISASLEPQTRMEQFARIGVGSATPMLVAMVDGDGESLRIVSANDPAVTFLGCDDVDALIGHLAIDAYPILGQRDVTAALTRVARGGSSVDLPVLTDGDAETLLMLHAFALPDGCIGITMREVATPKLPEITYVVPTTVKPAEHRSEATVDPFTGMADRAAMHQRLHDALIGASETEGQVALLLLDFEDASQRHGIPHEIVQAAVGQRLNESLHDVDAAGHMGNDQFAVMVTGDLAPMRGSEAAKDIVDAFSQPITIDGAEVLITVAIGVTYFPDHADDIEGLLQRADTAMLTAQATNTGVAVYTTNDDRSSIQRFALMGELRRALELDQFVVHYQPIVNAHTNEIVAAEALVRWMHPDEGLLAPSVFLGLAEQAGMMSDLAQLVVRQVARDVTSWRMQGHECTVAVNLGLNSLLDQELITWLGQVVRGFGIGDSPIQVEITERDLQDDPATATAMLHQLRAEGISVSIDDFGTGYSSLSMIRSLPIDELKIDKSFMKDLADGDTTLVRSIIELGHNLGVRVVAEGVETKPVLDRVRELGCDRAQGYLIARPMTVVDFERRLVSGPETPKAETTTFDSPSNGSTGNGASKNDAPRPDTPRDEWLPFEMISG